MHSPTIHKTPTNSIKPHLADIVPQSTFDIMSNDYRIFAIGRMDKYILITNTKNEAIGYVKEVDFILKKATDDREFKKQIRRVDLRFRD
tara:strand:- start:526 stop:792 length:267 start_codon:yes stop_codon:yes gene_type:complete